MNKKNLTKSFTAFALIGLGASTFAGGAAADPCGMVPPIYEGQRSPIVREGLQQTYVFFDNTQLTDGKGLETLVIRPSFTGSVDNFGMLIPFPAVPALRKVPDDIFTHIKNSVEPPTIFFENHRRYKMFDASVAESSAETEKTQLTVLKEEAVGMYQIAVLEARSPKALERWMSENGYQYPGQMGRVVGEYIEEGWVFVAVKTRVGAKASLNPAPGMRAASMPAASSFQGSVQAMGFRFRVESPVVPMRLSTFNDGELRNVVYMLADEPVRISQLSPDFVKRQLTGTQLYDHVHKNLPAQFDGSRSSFSKAEIERRTNPVPHNGLARDLYASDLLSVQNKTLSQSFEEREKALLNVNERLNLRGPAIDEFVNAAIGEERQAATKEARAFIKRKTLTVIHGDFPRVLLQNTNLTFENFTMPSAKNIPTKVENGEDGLLMRAWKSLWD